MNIIECKVNRIKNPLGFLLTEPSLSWKVVGSAGKRAEKVRVMVALDEAFTKVCYDSGEKSGEDVQAVDFPLLLTLSPRTRYWWRVWVRSDAGEEAMSTPAWFETGKMDEPFAGHFITPTLEKDVHPLLRRTFTLPSAPKSARLYATGLGVYQFWVNGQKGSGEAMAPGCTAYDKWIQYQTYDITSLLYEGANTLGVMLGNGWARGRFGFDGKAGNFETGDRGAPIDMFADRFWFLGEVRVQCEDGSEVVLGTDESWQCAPSPVTFSSIYDGERYEQGRETPHWAEPEGDTAFQYAPVTVGQPAIGHLTARMSVPVVEKHTLHPTLIRTPRGETVLDMGQNITGSFRFQADLPAGTKIRLQVGELLQDGCFYRDNLRSALAEYRFISAGRPAVVEPLFTFYGYRYINVTGWPGEVDPAAFEGVSLYTDLPRTGWLETGNDKVNRLFENALWSQRDNFLDVPTDCPQRDERMGWTGDAQVFISTACFNMDCAPLYDKYCRDLREEQRVRRGAVPFVAPVIQLQFDDGGSGQEGACGWADAGTVVPWMRFLYNGGKEALRRAYPGMKAWADWVYNEDKSTGNTRLWQAVKFHFGDWLALDGPQSGFDPEAVMGGTDMTFLCSVYYFYSTTLTAKAADVLGLTEDKERYTARAGEILSAIRREYYTPGGRLAADTQTGLVLSLFFGICPPEFRQKTTARLMEKLKENNMKLKTGFLGTPYLCRALSENGENEAAYTLLLDEKAPGWLYEVNLGATTIWERWNSVLPDGTISGTGMNSMNHYAYGSIVEWMYRHMCGLRPSEKGPGFTHVQLYPQPDRRMQHARARVNTAAGWYESGWQAEETGFSYDFTVPFGAQADLFLPGADLSALTVNGIPVTEANLQARQEENGVSAILKAGSYHFV